MKVAVCIERLEAHNLTFREGETYLANMVNPHYWIVDSIGIVEELIVDKTSGSTDVTNRKFVEEENDFKKFLNEFGFKDKGV